MKAGTEVIKKVKGIKKGRMGFLFFMGFVSLFNSCFYFLGVLEIESRASSILSRHSTTELLSEPQIHFEMVELPRTGSDS